jgi:hypothetical protein
MTLADALDIAVARTGWDRYRILCDPVHPSHELYAQVVREIAAAPAPVAAPPWLALPRVAPVMYGDASVAEKGCGCGRA